MPFRPELVMPAGTLEKLCTAVQFGADAVYTAGKDYGMRAFAGNLDIQELRRGVDFAHKNGVNVYVTVNIVAHNRDLEDLPLFLEQLAEIPVDGIIAADHGIIRLARRYAPGLPITISTQANVCNYESALYYEDLGVKRIVLARELSIDEIAEIRRRVSLELEVFVHGAMCVAHSGRCLLSYYMTGRSANRGECAHPCRYRYDLVEEKRPGQYYSVSEDQRGTYLLNSKDLCLINELPELIRAGVNAFKVEGRMKSPLYVATVAGCYRSAIDSIVQGDIAGYQRSLPGWKDELAGVSNRPFTNGFFHGPDLEMNDISKDEPALRTDFCGVVVDYLTADKKVVVEQRANFGPDEMIEFLIPGEAATPFKAGSLSDEEGNPMDRARHPRQRVVFSYLKALEPGTLLRRRSAVIGPKPCNGEDCHS